MNIISVTLAAIAFSFLVAYIYSTIKIKRMSEAFAKLFVAQATLEEFLSNRDNSKDLRKTDQDIHKENFIKFLSDSRDWAYQYIEEVQKGLDKFIKEVGPEIEYYNKYGIVVEGMIGPHNNALKKISTEFEQLKKLLPEEPSDRR